MWTFWTTLLLGIILGWVLEWLLELFVWRGKRMDDRAGRRG